MSRLPAESNVKKFLESVPLFEGIDEKQIKKFVKKTILRQYKKNAIIINQDDETDSIYFIFSGKVRAYRDDEQGREITLNILNAGQFFGEFSLLSRAPRIAHVAALEHTVTVIASKSIFMSAFGNNATIAWRVSEILADKIRASTLNASNLALLDTYSRVSRTLFKNAEYIDGRLVVENLTHQEIAHMIGASREMVSRIMKDMRLNQELKNEGRKIVLLKEPDQ